MQVKHTHIEGCFVIQPSVYEDERGIFFESFNQRIFEELTGLPINFVQDNQSISEKGVLRGLHLQKGEFAQAKLVRVIKGEVLDVAVDLRPDSKTYGEYVSVVLNETNNYQLFIPRGFAHGFVTLSEEAIFAYKCDNYYNKSSEFGIRFNDPDLNIDWTVPNSELKLSEKDWLLPVLSTFKN